MLKSSFSKYFLGLLSLEHNIQLLQAAQIRTSNLREDFATSVSFQKHSAQN